LGETRFQGFLISEVYGIESLALVPLFLDLGHKTFLDS